MKSLGFFLFLCFVEFAAPSPLTKDEKNQQWTLIPDSSGKMHLVDLQSYVEPIEPLFVAENDVRFLLFTHQNPTVGQLITFDLASLRNSNYNPNNPTHFTVHGWQGDADTESNSLVHQAFFSLGDYNMITVDWGVGASSINYITSRNRVGEVAAFLARFIDFLHLNQFLRFEEVHLIGISLGGQIVGLTGKAVQRGKVQVIMSLDPAGPLFNYNNPNERVAPTDGVYVEVIHTNGGGLGFREPIGQADFFPNFGQSQPGCGTDLTGFCAHARSVHLHAESITRVFTGHECSSFEEIDAGQCTRTGRTGRMGGPVGSIGLTGNFYLTTNEESPFSLG